MGRDRVSHDVAAKWRATRWWDVDIGDPEIVVWGSPIELDAQDRAAAACATACCAPNCCRRSTCPKANLDRFVERIRARRPKMLFGYPSALALHRAPCREPRHPPRRARHPRRVRHVGAPVRPSAARRSSATFGCPVANGYGGRDAGFIAHECPAGSLHVTAEDIDRRAIDARGPRRSGGRARRDRRHPPRDARLPVPPLSHRRCRRARRSRLRVRSRPAGAARGQGPDDRFRRGAWTARFCMASR